MMFGLSQFFVGEERVTTELLPFAIAAPDRRPAHLPRLADRRRGAALRLLRPLLPRGARLRHADDRRQPRRSAREHQRRVQAALRRDPARLRRDPAQGPLRHGGAGARDHRLHDRDRGHPRPHRGPLHPPLAEGDGPPARLPRRASPTSTATSRATSASASSSSPTRSSTTSATSRSSRTRSRRRCRSACWPSRPTGSRTATTS